jgi:hypothetical protein
MIRNSLAMTVRRFGDDTPAGAAISVRRFGQTGSKSEAAAKDLAAGMRDWGLWPSLAWLDVKQCYRRAVLGSFWITISMCVLVFALGILYAGIFRQDIRDFLPYLAAGFVVWNLISTTVIESTATFVQAKGLIKQGGIPLSVHVFRTVFRNLIVGPTISRSCCCCTSGADSRVVAHSTGRAEARAAGHQLHVDFNVSRRSVHAISGFAALGRKLAANLHVHVAYNVPAELAAA